MDIEKICRTCLSLSGPLLSLFDGDSEQCLATMLNSFTTSKARHADKLPEKVCLACISEINRCYSFKMKCENSNRTLRQLVPNALPEEAKENCCTLKAVVPQSHKAIQTEDYQSKVEHVAVQTKKEQRPHCAHKEIQTLAKDFSTVATSPSKPLTENIQKSPRTSEKVDTLFQMKTRSSERRKRSAEKNVSPKESKRERCLPINNEVVLIKDDSLDAIEIAQKQEIDEEIMHTDEELLYNEENELDANNQNPIELPALEIEDGHKNKAKQENYVIYDESMSNDENGSHYEYMLCSDENGETTFVSKTPPSNTSSTKDATPEESEQIQLKPKNTFKKLWECSSCLQSFVSSKTLERHKLKWHTWKIVDDTGLEEDTSVHYVPEARQQVIKETQQQQVDTTLFEEVAEVTEVQFVMPQPTVVKAKGMSGSQFFCECGAGFAGQTALSLHRKKKVCDVKTYQCNECQRVFISEEMLLKHKETHVLSNMCIDCHSLFETPEELSEHMVTEHNRKMCNQCTICKKVFTMLSALKDHMRVHSGEKPFLCTICGKNFSQNANLKQHLQRHSNDKPYKCEYCPKSYVTKSEVLSHSRTHTRDSPFKCEQCHRSYTTPSSLMKHRRSHTGERPYACEMCPLRFATLNVLKNHVRTHTGERPYKCNFCNRSFKQSGDRRLHEKSHTVDKSFVCNICNETSRTEAQAIRHANKCMEKTEKIIEEN